MPIRIPGASEAGNYGVGPGAISLVRQALAGAQGPTTGTPIFGGTLLNMLASAGEPMDLLFKETAAGGMAGIGVGTSGDLWTPTMHGSYMVRPKAGGEGGLRAVGGFLPAGAASLKERLTFGAALAHQYRRRELMIRSGTRGARQAIQQSLTALGPIAWNATRGPLDYLRATSTLSEQVAANLSGVAPGMSGRIGSGPRIPTDAVGHLNKLASIIASGTGLGLSPTLGKPETLLQGVYGAQPGQVSPFSQFFKAGSMNYQHIAFPEISAGTVAGMEGWLGGAVPRIGAKGSALRNFGEFQEVFGRVAVVAPRSRFGQAITRGAAGYEGVILNERFRNMAFQGGQVEVGTAMSIMGQKFNVAGFGSEKVMSGRDALITANLMKNPEAYVRASLGHVVAEAWSLNKGKLPQEFQNHMRTAFGEVELNQTRLMMGPTANRISSVGMATRKVRDLARAAGVSIPFAVDRMAGVGRARTATIPMSFRGTFAATTGGVRFDPNSMMMMASMGRSSSHIARSLLRHVRSTRGVEARQTLAFLNPMLGRAANLSGIQQMAAGAFDPAIHGLTSASTAGEVQALQKAGILPMGPRAIKLSTSINVPTQRAFDLLGPELNNWSKFRGSGYTTDVLPMPGLSGFKRLMGTEASAAGYLPKFVAQYGEVVSAAQSLDVAVGAGKGVGSAQIALEKAYGSMGSMIMGHSGKHGLISNLINPRMQINRSIYATLQGGQAGAVLRGVAGPMDVGVGNVALSPGMARKMGLGGRTIAQIQGGREFFVGAQINPSVSGATSRVMRLRIDPRMTGEVISTNVADRLAGFRDLDWDKMHLYLFPSEVGRKMRSSLRAAQLEQIAHVKDLYRLAKGNVLLPGAASLAGLSTEAAVAKAISQKVLTPLWDKPVRMWQGTALQKFQHRSGDVVDALGVAYQMAIQKGGGGEGIGLLQTLHGLGPSGNLDKAVPRIQEGLTRVAAAARNAGQVGFGAATPQLARRLGEVAMAATQQQSSAVFSDLYSTQGGMAASKFLNMLAGVQGQNPGTGRLPDLHRVKMFGMGSLDVSIDDLADKAGLTLGKVNAALKEEGLLGAVKGFWGKNKWAKIGLGAFGALLGLRILKSHTIGDEPSSDPAMRVSPELAASAAMHSQQGSSPLPPRPLLGPGLHSTSMPRPYVPFSPPPARINSPLSRGQEIRINASETTGLDLHQMGLNLSSGLELAGARPSLTGVYSTTMPSSRLADLNEREDRLNSRFFNPV